MNDKVHMARIKFRQAGEFWIAVLKKDESKDDERFLGSIPMEAAKYNDIRNSFTELAKACAARIISEDGSEVVGYTDFVPPTERSGKA